jgi:hypothetical protein
MKLTTDQVRESRKNRTEARKHFWPELNGKCPNGLVLHHKDEMLFYNDTARYIQWRPEDLEVMTHSKHSRMHNLGKQRMLGHAQSEDTKKKIGAAHIGNTNCLGKRWKLSDEIKQKHRELHLGKKASEEAKRHMSEARKGMKWYNNGITETFAKTTPGSEWSLGRLKRK